MSLTLAYSKRQSCNKYTDGQGTDTIRYHNLARQVRHGLLMHMVHAVIKCSVMEMQCIDLSCLPSRSELTPLPWGAM